jgi:hypothetical protein
MLNVLRPRARLVKHGSRTGMTSASTRFRYQDTHLAKVTGLGQLDVFIGGHERPGKRWPCDGTAHKFIAHKFLKSS